MPRLVLEPPFLGEDLNCFTLLDAIKLIKFLCSVFGVSLSDLSVAYYKLKTYVKHVHYLNPVMESMPWRIKKIWSSELHLQCSSYLYRCYRHRYMC